MVYTQVRVVSGLHTGEGGVWSTQVRVVSGLFISYLHWSGCLPSSTDSNSCTPSS